MGFFKREKQFANESKFNKVAQEIYNVNYNKLDDKSKRYITNKIITEDNRVYCEHCGQEDHKNEGECKFCGASVAKKVGAGFVDCDNETIVIGNNNIVIKNTSNKNVSNKINVNGNSNIVMSGVNTSNVNIKIN